MCALYKGTILIGGGVPDAANKSLSNLNSTGQGILNAKANTDLSNLSSTGKAVIDGQWVNSEQWIISSSTNLYDGIGVFLSYRMVLPNDGHIYEILVSGFARTSNTSGHFVRLSIWGNNDTYARDVCGTRTRANNFVDAWGSTLITANYVASGSSNIYVQCTDNANGDGTCEQLIVKAYRRIGTNI